MLTVLKKNRGAVQFYRRIGFSIDSGSPSRHGEKAFYEIMSILLSAEEGSGISGIGTSLSMCRSPRKNSQRLKRERQTLSNNT